MNEKSLTIIKEVIFELTGIEKEHLTPNAMLYNDLGIESADLMAAQAILEDKYNITPDEKEWLNIMTIGDAAKSLEKLYC